MVVWGHVIIYCASKVKQIYFDQTIVKTSQIGSGLRKFGSKSWKIEYKLGHLCSFRIMLDWTVFRWHLLKN